MKKTKLKAKIEIKFEFMGKVLTPTIDIKYSNKKDLKNRYFLIKKVKQRVIKDMKKLEKAILGKNEWDADTSRYYPKFIAMNTLMLDALICCKKDKLKLVKNKDENLSRYEPKYRIDTEVS